MRLSGNREEAKCSYMFMLRLFFWYAFGLLAIYVFWFAMHC